MHRATGLWRSLGDSGWVNCGELMEEGGVY